MKLAKPTVKFKKSLLEALKETPLPIG